MCSFWGHQVKGNLILRRTSYSLHGFQWNVTHWFSEELQHVPNKFKQVYYAPGGAPVSFGSLFLFHEISSFQSRFRCSFWYGFQIGVLFGLSFDFSYGFSFVIHLIFHSYFMTDFVFFPVSRSVSSKLFSFLLISPFRFLFLFHEIHVCSFPSSFSFSFLFSFSFGFWIIFSL